jgi:hypothetical protein
MDAETQHPTWRIKVRRVFQQGGGGGQVVGRKKPAHHQEYCSYICGGLYLMSRLICMIFVADLLACRIEFFMSAVCRPGTQRLWSGFPVWLL